jgi:hypothetical protein
VSTVALVLHALPLMATLMMWFPLILILHFAANMMPRAGARGRVCTGTGLCRHHKVFVAAVSTSIACGFLGYGLYIQYYRRCRPWMGWLLFTGIGVILQVVVFVALIKMFPNMLTTRPARPLGRAPATG